MKTNFKLITLLLITVTLFNCKKEKALTNPKTLSTYKFEDKPIVLTCENSNSKLFHEALYSFEDDILRYYQEKRPKTPENAKAPDITLVDAYRSFIQSVVFNSPKHEDIISQHTYDVFDVLKSEPNLWNINNKLSHLNYKSASVNCITEKLINKKLKTTFNALVSTNSMSVKLFGRPMLSNYKSVTTDKHLAFYIALDLFYSKFFNIYPSKANTEKKEPTPNTNTAEPNKEIDPHAGHNH